MWQTGFPVFVFYFIICVFWHQWHLSFFADILRCNFIPIIKSKSYLGKYTYFYSVTSWMLVDILKFDDWSLKMSSEVNLNKSERILWFFELISQVVIWTRKRQKYVNKKNGGVLASSGEVVDTISVCFFSRGILV